MKKTYEFSLFPRGVQTNPYDPDKPRFYDIGTGTLKQGEALIENMAQQHEAWKYMTKRRPYLDFSGDLFDLPVPSEDTPLRLWEGSEILASGGPFGEHYGIDLHESYVYRDSDWQIIE